MKFSQNQREETIAFQNGPPEKYEIKSAFSLKHKNDSLLGHSVKDRILECSSVITFDELNDMYQGSFMSTLNDNKRRDQKMI